MMYEQYFSVAGLTPELSLVVILVAIWSIIWKGIGLWKAARNNHTAWYVIMLLLNTVGILEIVYIFFFSKKKTNVQQTNMQQ